MLVLPDFQIIYIWDKACNNRDFDVHRIACVLTLNGHHHIDLGQFIKKYWYWIYGFLMALPVHRPGFDWNHFGTHREVFPYEDGAVNCVVPHRRVVSAVHNIYLDFHGSGQGRVAFVLGGRLQFVGFALDGRRNIIPMLRFIGKTVFVTSFIICSVSHFKNLLKRKTHVKIFRNFFKFWIIQGPCIF